jgi:hypothetical protein
VTDPGLRASDADRQRVVAELERHTAAGRLSLDEFGERVEQVLRSATHGQLVRVTADLPQENPSPVRQEHGRQLIVAFGLAILALLVLSVVFAIGHH